MKRREFRTRELVRLYTIEGIVDGYVAGVGVDFIALEDIDYALVDRFYFDDIDEIQSLR